MDSEGYPRDFLRRFAGASCDVDTKEEAAARAEPGEVELSLGLSLNGCFGVEPKEKRLGLARSSSLSFFEHDDFTESAAPLTRTCSLPAETAEELRKRKELQSLKRLEAKRKRSEKRNHKSCGRDPIEDGFGGETDDRRRPVAGPGRTKSGKLEVALNGFSVGRPVNGVVPPGLPGWKAGSGGQAAGHITTQLSIGRQGNDVAQVEHQQVQDDGSPLVMQALPDHANHKASPVSLPPVLRTAKSGLEELSKKTAARTNGARERERNVMEEMPCVSTRGDGPNGRRIEGFLYRYRKGEEVRIVCVCHGSFLTPAEFVRHAGGGDVDQPLKHIVVYPTPSVFL